ncbi:MAG: energy-coupled thiamine transporter ThiT [Clostridia bacterium]|nr:energy-coupled thiamine transporter ThiT [Clostridia bacterium]
MFHFSLLAAVSEKTTDIVTWVSIGCIAALAITLTLLCIFGKKYSTREIAYAGICLALSFALSFIKVSPVQFGGSITLASFVPLLIYSYKFGPVKGTLAGLMLGLFNFISDPFILTPLTFILDYALAFASIGLMGFAPKFGKLPLAAKVSIGTVLVYVARFIFHLLSGFIYFAENSIWVDLPTPNMFVYSFIYQCVYLPADCVICIVVLFITARTKALDKLLSMMDNKNKKTAQPVPEGADTQPAEVEEIPAGKDE